jgi:hypothetical protein
MLVPVDGHFICEDKCDFTTCDIFEFLDHCGVEFSWGVKLSKRYSFDLFTFLEQLNNLIDEGDGDAIYDHVQNATLMMVNASDDTLEPFIEEMVVAAEMDDVFEGVEKLLKENNE